MVMEVARVDRQGRLLIPKSLREKKGLKDEVELVDIEEGIIVRPKRARSWGDILSRKLKVEWAEALTVSLEKLSLDDLLLGKS